MLRELIDRAALEDLAGGLARAAGLRVALFDQHGELICASPACTALARLRDSVPRSLPRPLELLPLPAADPPARVAFLEHLGVWYVVVPVFVQDKIGGFVAVGEFREPGTPSPPAFRDPGPDPADPERAWEELPELHRASDAHPVVIARWASRLLADRCRQEASLESAAEEIALVGDIGALLGGEEQLQTTLQRIVTGTARVMKCPFCSMRLYDPRSDELRIVAVHGLSPEYLAKGTVRRSENPIDDQALRGQIVYIEDVQRDPRVRYPEQARREGIVSGLTVGMIYRGQPVGVLRVYTDRPRRFRTSQRHLLRAVASQAATAIVGARLAEERLRRAELERQIAMAGQLQARMVRTTPPEFPGIQAAMLFEPSWHIGGDFCDLFLLPDGRFAAVIADVVGHGLAASLLMAYTSGALRAEADACPDLGQVLTRLNRHICRETRPSEFVTLLIVAIDPQGRRLSLCSAGHSPPLLLRDGKILEPDHAGLVLGVDPGEVYHESTVNLHPDDVVLLYTDGAVEAMNFEGQPFGRPRLLEALRTYGHLPPEQTLRNIRWDIRRFVGLADQSDDLTLVALRVRPPHTPAQQHEQTVQGADVRVPAPALQTARSGAVPRARSLYAISTVAPASSSSFFHFSASALLTPSSSFWGQVSTRALASLRPRSLRAARTTLIT
jgi:serine phosphatase RsbU (regulator of sigma subunit)